MAQISQQCRSAKCSGLVKYLAEMATVSAFDGRLWNLTSAIHVLTVAPLRLDFR